MFNRLNEISGRSQKQKKRNYPLQGLVALVCICLFPAFIWAEETEPALSHSTGMPVWEAVALGFIEGMTEYLPISSTGHLLIFQHWLGRDAAAEETEAADALTICIQSGAILAVVLLYYRRLLQMLRGIMGGDPDGLKLFVNLIVAFFPTAVAAILFQKKIKAYLFDIRPITCAVLVGGLVILAMARRKPTETASEKELTDLKPGEAFLIGCWQCLALWPGFSRSLATILGCRMMKLKMPAAVEFSFLLGLITLTAATAKEGISHGSKIIELYGVTSPILALVVAFVSAVVSVKFMIKVLSSYGLTPFGFYRIALAAFCLLLWK